MGTAKVVDLSTDDEGEQSSPRAQTIELESDFLGSAEQQIKNSKSPPAKPQISRNYLTGQDSEENIISNGPSTGHSSSSVSEQGLSTVDDAELSFSTSVPAAPLCRQFWKAGNHGDGFGSKVTVQNVKNYLHVHPMFLHSNATSHKWAFGAIAELLDNAFDELNGDPKCLYCSAIQNGATFVNVDKTLNPKDGSPALLIQDDGGGMDPEAMRNCMSFGFSDKKSKFAIGRYGNGFKTSSMRLGADVIVFSRHQNNRIFTLSIGLLSYTFLMRTRVDRIVVPMVNFEFDTATGLLEILNGREQFLSNLSLLLRWSPYSSESELLKQFDDIGDHGTKVVIYNLWFNDDGNLELDFNTDPEDICSAGDVKKINSMPAWKEVAEQHIANRFHYSLRVYLSILYLRVPESYRIILRGKVVEPHNIADDLKFTEYILYKPQVGGCKEGAVVTTIGFIKEAPHINIHGFNVYHKNRLILPFWQVVSFTNSRGRGVVGILQADFVEPTHNKQDFERTSLFQKLEVRLKEMTWEYWDYHCVLIGYHENKLHRASVNQLDASLCKPLGIEKSVTLNRSSSLVSNTQAAVEEPEHVTVTPNSRSRSEQGVHAKRKAYELLDLQKVKRQTVATPANPVTDQETINLLQENKKLHARCLEFEKKEEEYNLKVMELGSKIQEAQHEYDRLLAELQSLGMAKEER